MDPINNQLDSPFALIAKLEGITVLHAAYTEVMNGLLVAIEMAKYTSTPSCALLTGHAGVGKSNLCKAIVSMYRDGPERSPAYVTNKVGGFYIPIPSPVTIKSLVSAMLAQLGDPRPRSGTVAAMKDRLMALENGTALQVHFLDELQHLWAAAPTGEAGRTVRDNIRNWIKTYVDNVRVPLVLVGTPSCEELVNEDDQLSRRFPHRYRLTNIPMLRNGEPEFQKYLVTYADLAKKTIGVDFPAFTDRDEAIRVYAATLGNASRVYQLFKSALVRSLKADAPASGSIFVPGTLPQMRLSNVTLNHFALAADEPYFALNRATQRNPFNMDIKAVINDLPNPEVSL